MFWTLEPWYSSYYIIYSLGNLNMKKKHKIFLKTVAGTEGIVYNES